MKKYFFNTVNHAWEFAKIIPKDKYAVVDYGVDDIKKKYYVGIIEKKFSMSEWAVDSYANDLVNTYPDYYETVAFCFVHDAIKDALNDGHWWETVAELHEIISEKYI